MSEHTPSPRNSMDPHYDPSHDEAPRIAATTERASDGLYVTIIDRADRLAADFAAPDEVRGAEHPPTDTNEE